MNEREAAEVLLAFIPNVEEKFRARNRDTLEGWRAGELVVRELGSLLSSWAHRYGSAFDDAQRMAVSSGILWLSRIPIDRLGEGEFALMQAISNFAAHLPWQDERFASNTTQLLDRIGPASAGDRLSLARGTVERLLAHEALPSHVSTAARAAYERLARIAIPTKSRPAVMPEGSSQFRLTAPIPSEPKELLLAACQSLETLHDILLDPRQRSQNQRAIDQARRFAGADPGFHIEFLCYFVFSKLDRLIEGDHFKIKPRDVYPLYVIAALLDTRPVPTTPIPRQAAPFIFWFKAVVDVDNNNASPGSIVDRFREQSRTGVLGKAEDETRTFIRIGNQYMTALADRKEIDPNIVVEWLEAYRLVAFKADNVLDPALTELLATAVSLAKPHGADARVGTLLDMLDPANAKHPWTLPAVFPMFTSPECEALSTNMRQVRLPAVQQFLARPDVIARLKDYLLKTLADDEHTRYRQPTRGTRPARLDDARREYERRATTDRGVNYGEAREWYAFELAKSGDVGMAQPLWEAVAKDVRTPEERWNLAVFSLTVGAERAAFDELWEQVRLGDAPYEHLRFAAYLALALDDSVEGAGVPVLDVLRLLPIPAAHALAFAKSPPDERRAWVDVVNDIRKLADQPIEDGLRKYRNPRSPKPEVRDRIIEQLEAIRVALIERKLKTTWRLWLTGYINLYPRSRILWEKLYESWSNDDPKIAREKLERALQVLGNATQDSDRWELMYFLRTYLQTLEPDELPRKRPMLQRLAHTSGRLIQDRDFRTAEKIWPKEERPKVITSEPWSAIEANKLLVRRYDESALTPLVTAGFAQLKQLAPDVSVIDEWAQAYLRFTEMVKSVPSGSVNPDNVAKLNAWLLKHPASSCEGLLAKVRPLAEWIHKLFAEQVKEAGLAPVPRLSCFEGDPGVALNQSECSAVVDVISPGKEDLHHLRLAVVASDSIQRSGEPSTLSTLVSGTSTSVSVPFSMSAEDAHDPLLVKVSVMYSWGVVNKLTVSGELTYPRFDFGGYLDTFGLKQEALPGNMFMFDRPIEISEIKRSFIGREQDIAYARNVFSDLQKLPGTPIYIHGIRKVGKTSLLHRLQLDDVLPGKTYVPIYVSLFGITKETPLVGQCLRIRREVMAAIEGGANGLEQQAPSIDDGPDYKVLEAWEQFVSWLRATTAPRLPVLLLDEFHNLCVPQAAPLLDLIRGIYQKRQVLFVLAGWVDHEVLRKSCPASQIFPLEQKSISFLSEIEVQTLIETQLGRYGVKVGRGVLVHLMRLTEGHPNLVQRICGLVVDELNRYRRAVVTVTDVERPSGKMVEDGSQFTNSQLNSWVVSGEERKAVNEIIAQLEHEGGWVPLNRLATTVRTNHIFPLVKKEVLTRNPTSGEVRIRGLLLERYLRSIQGITPDEEAPGKPNVAFVVDYENIVKLFASTTNPGDIAHILRGYAERLGNVKVCIVAANWVTFPDRQLIQSAFRAHKFTTMDSYRNVDRQGLPRRPGSDANLADFVIYREVYNRLMEERDVANDTIEIYAIAAGDGGYKDLIMDLVEKHGKKVHLLACREHKHLNPEYLRYEDTRRQVAEMPGEDHAPSFVIDDLTPLVGDRAAAST